MGSLRGLAMLLAIHLGHHTRCRAAADTPLEPRSLTYPWIKKEIEKEAAGGGTDAAAKYAQSTIVSTMSPTELGQLRKADGEEGFDKK